MIKISLANLRLTALPSCKIRRIARAQYERLNTSEARFKREYCVIVGVFSSHSSHSIYSSHVPQLGKCVKIRISLHKYWIVRASVARIRKDLNMIIDDHSLNSPNLLTFNV